MKSALIPTLASIWLLLPASADRLSDVDVQLLMDELKALKDGEKTRSETRFAAARAAFASAVQSEDAAHDLYLKCVEKVQFEDEQLSGQDFREWKRRHKERTDSPEFRRALRHQLNWLTLTLEVAIKEDFADMGPNAMTRLDAIMNDAEDLKGQQGLLRGNVLGTVFATAYKLGGLEIEDWPTAPLVLDQIYDKVIMPPLRRPDEVKALRSAWVKRIKQEGLLVEVWGREGDRNEASVDVARFLTETRPDLQWQMESDLFKAGDEKGAAVRMLTHIRKYLGHQNEAKWIEDFEALVSGGREATTADADDGAGS